MSAIFGIDYGGPSTAIVFQDRLVLAGGGAVPDAIAASRTGRWLDFDTGGADAAADDGFWFQQTSARGSRFHAMLQQQGLLIFGDLGESTVPPGPFTAEMVSVRENSWIGSDTGRIPIIAGNLVVFLQTGGEDVRGIVWNEQQLKYIAPSLLQTAGRVFRRGRDMTYQPSAGRRGDTVYVVDETDGSVAVCLLRVGEDQPAWSRWDTEGQIYAVAAPLGRSVFLVDRNGEVGLETLAEEGGGEMDCQVVLGDAETLPSWMEGLEGGKNPNEDEPAFPLKGRFVDGDTVVTSEDPFRVVSGRPIFLKFELQMVMRDGREVRRWVEIPSDETVDLKDDLARPRHPNTMAVLGRVEVGLRYERVLQTTQFVRRSAQGNLARMLPQRILAVTVDYVLPLDAADVMEARIQSQRTEMFVIPTSQGRAQRQRIRRQLPRSEDVAGRIASVQYPSPVGWSDRIAIELWSEDHFEVAGVAYRVSA